MPPKAHRPGLARTHSHSRSTSGSSSKLALNLHFTQKDVPQPKSDKQKRISHGQYTATRTGTALQKSNSVARIPSRENIAVLNQPANKVPPARAPRQSEKAQPGANGTKHKAGFTLASSTIGSDEDEDEWISSESGAATPNKHANNGSSSGSEDAPVNTPQDARQNPPALILFTDGKPNVGSQLQTASTPRAETPPTPPPQAQRRLDKSSTVRPSASGSRLTTDSPLARPARPSNAIHLPSAPAPVSHRSQVHAPVVAPRTPSPTPLAHSRTQPPTPTSPRPHAGHRSKRMSATRPPSVTSEHAVQLRPHPLIRGHSHGVGHLAPLAVSSTAAQAQLSASPPSTPPFGAHGPASASSDDTRFNRRLSTSSVRSIATLPAPAPSLGSGTNKDRTRTLSTLSSGSSAALSSLALIGAPPRRDMHAPLPRFPPSATNAGASMHTLLPPPYVQPHITVLTWRAPIRDAYERVLRAKAKKRAG
ncbi:hypothetical protein K488DRAFT_72939 [Vararia minispora EC-137]|uniref:Uncharacterized protein n=1 Tax=Vararia minispora EC-137 TaxID=1314806 RepID=A0ACB8QCW4_9AGAM|nr:hypothetical protein K488DRAFT_72939 [Vararia minispora EC-137]